MRELGLLSLGKRRLQGDFMMEFQYLKGLKRKLGTDLLAEPIVTRQGVRV